MNSLSRLPLIAFFVMAGVGLAATSAKAQSTYYWNGANAAASPAAGGTGTWNTSTANWLQGSDTGTAVAWPNASSNADAAVFGGTSGTVTLSGSLAANAVSFTVGGYTLTGGTLGLVGSAPKLSVSTGTATVSSLLTVTGGATKTGAGTLILSASNGAGFAGGVTVSSGILQLDSAFAAGGGTITLGDANTGSSNVQLTLGSAVDRSGRFTNAITVSSQGTGNATLKAIDSSAQNSGSGTITLNRATTFDATGLTGAGNAYYFFNHPLSGTGNFTLTNSNGVRFILNAGSANYTGDIAVQSGGVFEPRGSLSASTGNNVTVEAGGVLAIQVSGPTLIGSLAGSGTVQSPLGSGTLSVGKGDGSGTFNGILRDNGYVLSFTKVGSGTQTLAGSNTYSGTTTVSAGVLRIGNSGTTGSLSGSTAIAVSTGAAIAFQRNDVLTVSNTISGAGGLQQLGSGTLTVAGNNSYSGTTSINAGVLSLGSAAALGSSGTIAFGGGTLQFSSTNMTDYSNRFSTAPNQIYSLDTNGQSVTVALASLASAGGSLTKLGSGTLTLSVSNSYTGETRIKAGTLALDANGSFSSSPTITVGDAGSTDAVLDLTAKVSGFSFGSGQTVKGIGNIRMASGKALTINGTLAAGNSPGTLTISGGDLILGGSSVTNFEINGTDATVGSGINDLTRVAGSLTLGGTLNVSASPAFDRFGSRTYRIFDYATGGSGSLSGTGSMAIGTTPTTDYLYSLTNTATTVDLFVQRKAEQAATLAFSLPTSGTVNAFTSTNVSFSGTLANLTPSGGKDLAVSLVGNGGQVSAGSLSASSGSTVAGGSSATITGQIATGTTLGARTWSVVNTDTTALGSTTSTASGVVSVFAHGSPTLSTTSINFGRVLTGTTASQTVTVSNGTSSAANTGGITWTAAETPSGFGSGGAAQPGVVASGSGVTYTYTLATGSAASYSGSQAFSFNDDASILGNGSLGNLSVSLSGTVVNQRSFLLSTGTISLGNFLRTASVTGSTTISSNGGFSTTASGTLGTFNGTSTNGFSLGTSDSTAFNGGSSPQWATYRISGSASAAGAITGSFTSTVSAELGTIAPITVALTGTAFEAASISSNNDTAVGNNGTVSITNAGGLYRSTANVASTSLTGEGWSVTGFGTGSSAAAGATLSGTAQFNSVGLLSGTYTGLFTASLQNDQSLTGAGANDLGTVSWNLSQVVLNTSGTGHATLAANSPLNAVSLTSGTGAGATLASFAAGETGASPSTVIMSFTSGSTGQYSDILHLQGTNGLAQVLQLTYDPGLMDLTQQQSLLLGWLDTRTDSLTNGQWINSVLGNSGTNGMAMQSPFLGSWTTYAAQSGKTAATALGAFGVDTSTHTVWAAINHNSQFVVIVPEPGALALTGIGIAVAGWIGCNRKRRARK